MDIPNSSPSQTSGTGAEQNANAPAGSGSSSATAVGADQKPEDAPRNSSGNAQTQQPDNGSVPEPSTENSAIIPMQTDAEIQEARQKTHDRAVAERALGTGSEPPRFNAGAVE